MVSNNKIFTTALIFISIFSFGENKKIQFDYNKSLSKSKEFKTKAIIEDYSTIQKSLNIYITGYLTMDFMLQLSSCAKNTKKTIFGEELTELKAKELKQYAINDGFKNILVHSNKIDIVKKRAIVIFSCDRKNIRIYEEHTLNFILIKNEWKINSLVKKDIKRERI